MVSRPNNPAPAQRRRSATFLGRRALRFWPAAAGLFAALALASVLAGRLATDKHRSETILVYQVPGGGATAPEADAALARLRQTVLTSDRLASLLRETNREADGPAVQQMKARLEIAARGPGIFALAYTDDSPALAQTLTRRLAETLVAAQESRRRVEAAERRQHLARERDRVKAEAEAAGQTLATFLREEPDAAKLADRLPTPAEARVTTLERELERARAEAAEGQEARVAAVTDELARARSRLARSAARAADLRGRLELLREEVRRTSDRLVQLDDRLLRFDAAERGSGNDVGLLSIADPSGATSAPVTARRRTTSLLGLALAALAAMAFAIGRALTDDRLFGRADVVHLTSLPILASVPRDRAGRRRPAHG